MPVRYTQGLTSYSGVACVCVCVCAYVCVRIFVYRRYNKDVDSVYIKYRIILWMQNRLGTFVIMMQNNVSKCHFINV